MPFEILKVVHGGSMFIATARAVGPVLLLYVVARTEDPIAIPRAFAYATPIGRAGGACYGLGIIFGVAAALTGSLDLNARWLLTACVLVVLLGVNGLVFERWSHRVGLSVANVTEDGGSGLSDLIRAATPLVSLTVMVSITIAIIFVMVVKPDLLG